MEQEAFFEAIRRGDASAVARLLEERPDLARAVGAHGKTGLHWAAEHDRVDIARLLVDAGADLDARTSWGATPLAWAATMGSNGVPHVLLESGAEGFTLVVAAGLGMLDEVRATLESEADLAEQRARPQGDEPTDEWPPDSARLQGDVISEAMVAAARNGHTEVVDYLLGRGAVVDAKGFFGATGLHWAAINGHRSTADLLVRHGANLDLRDARFDATPAEWAHEGGHEDLSRKLGTGAPVS